MSQARWLTPEQLKEEHPTAYAIFYGEPEPEPEFKPPDGAPNKADYQSGREYAKAMAEWIKNKNVKMEL